MSTNQRKPNHVPELPPLNPETVEAVERVAPEVFADPVGAMSRLAAATKAAADAAEADPDGTQRARFRAFITNPPNHADLRRKVLENERLQGVWRCDIDDLDRQTPGLACTFCESVLSADLKSALVPLIVALPPKSTVACLKCTEIAYLARNEEERLEALKGRIKLGRTRGLPVVGSFLRTAGVLASMRLSDLLKLAAVVCLFGFPVWNSHRREVARLEREDLSEKCSPRSRASKAIDAIYREDPDVARALALDCHRAERLGIAIEAEAERFARELKIGSDSPRAREHARQWAVRQLRE